MPTLEKILQVLKANDLEVTEKQLAELISHNILVGAHYYKQLRKRQKVLSEIEDYDRETVTYFRIALGLCQINCDNKTAELLINIVNKFVEKGGKFSVDDGTSLINFIEEKYNTSRPE